MNLRSTTIIDMFKSALRISSKKESKNIAFFFFHLLTFMLQYIQYEMKTSLLLLLSSVIGSPEVFSEEMLHRKHILNR